MGFEVRKWSLDCTESFIRCVVVQGMDCDCQSAEALNPPSNASKIMRSQNARDDLQTIPQLASPTALAILTLSDQQGLSITNEHPSKCQTATSANHPYDPPWAPSFSQQA